MKLMALTTKLIKLGPKKRWGAKDPFALPPPLVVPMHTA